MKYYFSSLIINILLYISYINANSNYNTQILHENRNLKKSQIAISNEKEELYNSNDPLSIAKYCNRPWPQLELFLPVSLRHGKDIKRRYEVETAFWRSFNLFWPIKISNVSIVTICDEEMQNSAEFWEYHGTVEGWKEKLPGRLRLELSPPSSYYRGGSDRQQLMMFWADNYTSSEFVGFVDTDAVFLTYIDREDLFEDGKPVVNARSGLHKYDVWSLFPNSTYNTLGLKEPFRCMSYFPVIIKTKHLKELREYIEKKHKMSFNEAFFKFSEPKVYAQFNIFCTFLWNFHKDEYVWYVHTETPDWDGIEPPPNPGQDNNLSQFTKQMNFPKPRIATHARYRNPHFETNIYGWFEMMNRLLQRGMCMSPPFPRIELPCTSNESNSDYMRHIHQGYNEEMHRFEYFDFSMVQPQELLKQAYTDRYNRIKHCNFEWDKSEMEILDKDILEIPCRGYKSCK